MEPADTRARKLTDQAFKVLEDAMQDDDTKYRLAAAKEVLDRGYGKPLNATINIPTSRAAAQRMANMTDEEIMAALRATPLPSMVAPLITAREYEDATRPAIEHLIEVANEAHGALDSDFDPLLD